MEQTFGGKDFKPVLVPSLFVEQNLLKTSFAHASWGWCSSCETVLNDLCSVYKILQIPGSIQ